MSIALQFLVQVFYYSVALLYKHSVNYKRLQRLSWVRAGSGGESGMEIKKKKFSKGLLHPDLLFEDKNYRQRTLWLFSPNTLPQIILIE